MGAPDKSGRPDSFSTLKKGFETTTAAASAALTDTLDLSGRKGLVVGIANEHSPPWSSAQHFCNARAKLAVTYLNEKAKPFVEPLVTELPAPIFLPCTVATPGQIEAVFDAITAQSGRLDLRFQSIAWARKENLHDRLADCSADGFAESMLASWHPVSRTARRAELLMIGSISLTPLSLFGAERVVNHYYVIGPVKSALEASVRYLAHDPGVSDIRVNEISTGAVKTRAAAGIEHFDELRNETPRKAPPRLAVAACEVGRAAPVPGKQLRVWDHRRSAVRGCRYSRLRHALPFRPMQLADDCSR